MLLRMCMEFVLGGNLINMHKGRIITFLSVDGLSWMKIFNIYISYFKKNIRRSGMSTAAKKRGLPSKP